MEGQSSIGGSDPCLGGLGLSPMSFGGSLFWASVSSSIKWIVVRREVGLIALKLVVILSLVPCSLLTPPIVKVLSGAPWLLGVCSEVSSSVWLLSPGPVLQGP